MLNVNATSIRLIVLLNQVQDLMLLTLEQLLLRKAMMLVLMAGGYLYVIVYFVDVFSG